MNDVLLYYIKELKSRGIKIYQWKKEDIFKAECILLNKLGFDMIVYHPYNYLESIIEQYSLFDYLQISWYVSIYTVNESD